MVFQKQGEERPRFLSGTHAFRFAKWGEVPRAWGNGTWDEPALVDMNMMDDTPRNALWNTNAKGHNYWGKANFPLTGNLQDNINKAREANSQAKGAIPAF